MRKLVWLCGVILLLSVPAMAQDLPKFDVFGGYSYIHASFGSGGGSSGSGNITANLNGGSGAVGIYPSKHFGFVADFGGYKLGTLKQGSASLAVSGSIISYLFGPRIRFGGDKATPFVQALFGGAHIGDVTCSTSVTGCPSTGLVVPSANAFAMTLGGGVDIKVSHHLAVRGQAEYLMTRFKTGGGGGGTGTGSAATQNNARISVGIVIH
jgi:opacity protein-like surface antigen